MEDAIIREALKGETEVWYRKKVGEYRNFKQFRKGFMKNYWGMKEESVIKSKLCGTKFNHSLRQLEEEVLNKVKKVDEVVRILEIHYECEKNGRKYNHSGQGRNNHNYSQGPYQGIKFYHYHKNGNSRSYGIDLNINKIIQQPKQNVDTIEASEDLQDSDDDKDKEKCLYKIRRYFVERNLEEAILKKNVGIEMNIINGNVGKDAENDNVYEGNGNKEIVDMRNIMKGENV
ncbi:hypothetical protein FQA39_LY13432 [Lamprigera yunnana]|nr:hypothetical protein FQA39_LY13432 [Lamprigera yunnana]